MIYRNYKLDALIPAKKGDYANFDDYYKKILFNLAAHDLKEPTKEMDDALTSLYNLDDETYFAIIKKMSIYYSVFRKNALYIDKAVRSEEPVYTVYNMSEMYKIRNSVISRIVGDSLSNDLNVEELKTMADKMIFDQSFGVTECKKTFMERISNIRLNKELTEFANVMMDDNNVRIEFVEIVKERIKTKLANAERAAESGSHARVADSIQRYLKRHR